MVDVSTGKAINVSKPLGFAPPSPFPSRPSALESGLGLPAASIGDEMGHAPGSVGRRWCAGWFG